MAALQVALRARGLYRADVDGLVGKRTLAALRQLPGASTPLAPTTRAALGPFAAHPLGSRPLALRCLGWDVAALQFLLAWHGFPSGRIDGSFGPHTEAALVRFQRWAGIPPIGIAGPLTLAALRAPPPQSPIRLDWPLAASLGDGFGPRGARFHAGLDLVAETGTPVAAAAAGTVLVAGRVGGGYGMTVVVAHTQGVTTLYAHLSAILVRPGEHVAGDETVGLVGSTGNARGPHLHFEVRVRGAAVDPLSALS